MEQPEAKDDAEEKKPAAKDKKPRRMYGLRVQIQALIIVSTFLIDGILLIWLILSIQNYQARVDEAYMDQLDAYAQTLENEIEQLSDTVGAIYSSNTNFSTLGETGQSESDKWEDAWAIKAAMSQQVRANKYLSGLTLYYDRYERRLFYADTSVDEKDVKQVCDVMQSMGLVQNATSSSYLEGVTATDSSMWYYILMQKGAAAIAGFVDLGENLPDTVQKGSAGIFYEGGYYEIAGSGEELSIIFESLSNGKNSQDDIAVYYREIASLDIGAILVVPKTLFMYVNLYHLIAMILLLFFFCTMTLICRFLDRQLVAPLDDITNATKKIRAGNWEIEFLVPNQVQEIENVREAIRVMLNEIDHYKIRVYEEEIAKEQTQLQYLRLQLAPHFYTNCLKNAYYMLQLGEYDNAGQFLLCMSKHLRYLLRQDNSMVTLSEELDFVRNYIEMEQYLLSRPLTCRIDADPALLEARIPPLTIQTFVENAVKYARGEAGSVLQIIVKAVLLKTEEGNCVNLVVWDNGPGYDEAQLKELNRPNQEELAQKRGGIANLQSRLRLCFGDAASWRFASTGGGAASEIVIPFLTKERQEM